MLVKVNITLNNTCPICGKSRSEQYKRLEFAKFAKDTKEIMQYIPCTDCKDKHLPEHYAARIKMLENKHDLILSMPHAAQIIIRESGSRRVCNRQDALDYLIRRIKRLEYIIDTYDKMMDRSK